LSSVLVRDNAKVVLGRLLAPLAKHALQSGVSAREVQALWRAALVQEAARQQSKSSSRINVAGIAAATGISRADIAKILRLLESKLHATPVTKPHSINKILAVWNSSPIFANRIGRPKVLRIFGPGLSFENLVRENASGLPIRAVLDELIRLGSVEVIDSRKVRLISAVARNRGQSTLEIERLTEQVAHLLNSMLQRMRSKDSELLISTIDVEMDARVALPMFRKQVLSGSEDLLTDLRESFVGSSRREAKVKFDGARHHVRVAVIYQETATSDDGKASRLKRKNYRRTPA
jgi:hypothetical protein